jgi:hypothetical protein
MENRVADIYDLVDHLKRCPDDFLKTEVNTPADKPQTAILLQDLYRKIHGNFNVADSQLPVSGTLRQLEAEKLVLLQMACWFFSYPYFTNKPQLLQPIHQFLFKDLLPVAQFVKSEEWIEDEDRAEEFIRLALKRCAILPAGETLAQAADRLDALDTIKRQQVLRESSESIERVKEIRRKMAEEKAREAANVYGRE